MTFIMPHIAARLFGEPLMVDPQKLSAILMGIGGRIVDGGIVIEDVTPIDHVAFARGRPSDAMGRVGDPMGRTIEGRGQGHLIIDRVGAVGIIPVEGTLVHKGKFLGQSSGETSYEGIQTRVSRAARDADIKGVVFEVDSFGGEVAGAFETAGMIAELSKIKPTIAILTDFALSAGYLLASQARQIVMPQSGAAGSIGVITMHADFSKQLADRGIKVTLIASGVHKADAHPAQPLGDEVRTHIQGRVDRTREMFAAAVAAGRGKRLTREQALATEAQVYVGDQAVTAGLVDGIIEPSKAFRAFVERVH